MSECILSNQYIQHAGYARAYHGGKYVRLHRLVYCQANGLELEDIKGKVIRHTCDVRNCINPAHLVIGTEADNMRDKVERGRQTKGMEFKHAKLTDDAVREIRHTYVKGSPEFGGKALARKFGVSKPVIIGVIQNKLWRHVA